MIGEHRFGHLSQQFALRYAWWLRLLFTAGGHGPRVSGVVVDGEGIHAQSGWVFRVDVPRDAIAHAGRRSNPWWSMGGVQTNMRGAWSIGSAYRNIVAIDLGVPVTGRLFSHFAITVRRLIVCLEDPDGFLAALEVAYGQQPVRVQDER
jgi:hypothetical protein